MSLMQSLPDDGHGSEGQGVFASIARDLREHGFSIISNALPPPISEALFKQCYLSDGSEFSRAGIGRKQRYEKNRFVRNDNIQWIKGVTDAEQTWLDWMAQMQQFLNRHLLLGLFSFESHFAHYPPGAFYKKHLDAFQGQTNRILSTVTYLNPGWLPEDGGELLIYDKADHHQIARIMPLYGTLVVFLSEDFPHEVLPAQRDRYSVVGWFRVNSSICNHIDPPN